METRLQSKSLCLLAGMVLSGFFPAAIAEPVVNFTLSLNTAKDPGATYDNVHAADAGTADSFVIGFQVAVNSVDGESLNLSPLAAFCAEMEEPISTGTYNFYAKNLSALSAGQAGIPGTASSGIPTGGIGHQRAAYVNYLFDEYYMSEALSEWTFSNKKPTTHAFQLALWELTHDDDFSLSGLSGDLFVGKQTDGTRTEKKLRNNAVSLAQSMLNTVSQANVADDYISTKFSLWALVNTDGQGTTGYQDIVLATRKKSSSHEVLAPLLPMPALPEPTTHALITLSGAVCWFVSRMFRRR